MTTLALDSIDRNPDQPREHFAQAALEELADSIRAVGVLSPIIVRPVASGKGQPGHWRIVAGERRWRAARMAGLERVPVIVRDDLDDAGAFELAMIENVIREDMDPMEEAQGYQRLLDDGLTVDTIAERIGKAPSAVKARLALLNLNEAASDLVAKGHLDAWTAGHMARLSSESQHKVLRAMSEGLLPKGDQNAVDRLCKALAEQDSLVEAFGDELVMGGGYTELAALPEPDEEREQRRALESEVLSVLDRLERIAELLEADVAIGGDADHVGDVAARLQQSSGRIAKLLHTQAAGRLAAQLQEV